jgi:hypothetical protein
MWRSSVRSLVLILSLAVFSLPASPITVWPTSLPTLSLPPAVWPIGSFFAASCTAAFRSLDTGGGGPEGEPVGEVATQPSLASNSVRSLEKVVRTGIVRSSIGSHSDGLKPPPRRRRSPKKSSEEYFEPISCTAKERTEVNVVTIAAATFCVSHWQLVCNLKWQEHATRAEICIEHQWYLPRVRQHQSRAQVVKGHVSTLHGS